ncbi:cytochrome P450 [Streptomyces sp. NBC_01390]|uniref:cytochrome P450 n=1 Tax=Streptomyces sp. NBC_01390 TaxID=2903850 RepID=UPI00325570DC
MTSTERTVTEDPTHSPPLAFPAPKAAGCPFDPPPAVDRAHAKAPLTRVTLWDDSSAWLITGHQHVREVLGDPRFSAEATRPGFPFLVAGVRELVRTMKPTFFRLDDPEHARLRRMLTPDFMTKKVQAMRPHIERLTEDLLDRMTDGRTTADLVSEFALPLPSVVICLLLGVPYEDHEFFQERSAALFSLEATAEEVRRSQEELIAYLAEIAEHKKREPDDSIISSLVARGELGVDEIAATGRLLLVAGHETSANMIALSTLALLRHPEQLERLRRDPSLTMGAVEELLRHLTIVHNGIPRVAAEDVTVGGHTIRAGEGVLCMVNTANRDEEVFPGGATLDIGRNARRHLAFGFGVHQCLGQGLARLEIEIALNALLRRLPDLRLAIPFEDVAFRHDMAIYGLGSLPVAW